MCWLIIIIAVSFLAFMVRASAYIGSNVYVKSLCRAETEEKVVSLTFDDGPDMLMTPKVLDVLKKYDVRASFFLTGRNVTIYPWLVRRMVDEGHAVANHTYSHGIPFTLRNAGYVERELWKCSEAVSDAAGVEPLLFRPPFGVTNPVIGRVVRLTGLQCIGWSIRSLDTVASRSRKNVRERILKKLHPGAVVLLHDRCSEADVLLEDLIPSILGRGYRIVPINELLDLKVYVD